MDTTESLPIIAISIGLYQMFYNFNKVRKSDVDTEFDIVYILSGIIASLLWTVCISSERDQMFRSSIRPRVCFWVCIHS